MGKSAKTLYEISCHFCGTPFQSSRSNARFCSDNCRVKNNQRKKKQQETVTATGSYSVSANAANSGGQDPNWKAQQDQLHQLQLQHQKLISGMKFLNRMSAEAIEEKELLEEEIRDLRHWVKVVELEIDQLKEQQKKTQAELKFIEKAQKGLTKKYSGGSLIQPLKKVEQEIGLKKLKQSKTNEYEKYPSQIQNLQREKLNLESDLTDRREMLQEVKDELIRNRKAHKRKSRKLQSIVNRLTRPAGPSKVNPMSVPPVNVAKPVFKVVPQTRNAPNTIGAGDLQNMHFETFQLSGHLGAFLGNLDRNQVSIALTGDSGAGKSYFSFQLVSLFVRDLNIRAKYFSLEEGVGRLTQEKVAPYNLGNELSIAGTGTLEDVKQAAKEYPLVVVDSFTALGAKTNEFEALRKAFPKTIFLLIFQKTTAGTIRGGSAIKYNSSATIDVVKRDGERIAIMEKGRYGTIGWEYSISRGIVIKANDTLA
ncbi:MAG: hypothetical protein ACFB10_21410 [Salibacteraceae bacterium]